MQENQNLQQSIPRNKRDDEVESLLRRSLSPNKTGQKSARRPTTEVPLCAPEETVSYETHRQLIAELERTKKKLENGNRERANYKKSLNEYRKIYQRDKVRIRQWIDYFEGEHKHHLVRAQEAKEFLHQAKALLSSHAKKPDESNGGFAARTGLEAFPVVNDVRSLESSAEGVSNTRSDRNADSALGDKSPRIDKIPNDLRQSNHRASKLRLNEPEVQKRKPSVSNPLEQEHEFFGETPLSPTPNRGNIKDASLVQKDSSSPSKAEVTQSSQSTEVDVCNEEVDKNDDGGSSPVLVSYRLIKHKHPREIPRTAPAAGRHDDEPVPVKQEDSCSPISFTAIADPFNEQDLDLDEIYGHVNTPRKRKLVRALSRLNSRIMQRALSNLHHERSNSLPPDIERKVSLNQSFQAELDNQSSRKRNSSEEPDLPEIKQENEHEVNIHRATESHVLQPLDNNRQLLPKRSNKRKKRSSDPRSISEFTEDGESFEKCIKRHAINEPRLRKSTNSSGKRISGLLETPNLSKQSLGAYRSTTPRRSRTYTSSNKKNQVEVHRNLQHHDKVQRPPQEIESPNEEAKPTTAVKHARASPQRKTYVYADSKIHPEDHLQAPKTKSKFKQLGKPLRDTPISQLKLEDFKINPNTNHGHDFAFKEVVRNREQRHCLPNCTRPECCGTDFRKMIEIGGAAPDVFRQFKPGLWDLSQPSDSTSTAAAEEERRLLVEYLGSEDKVRSRLARETEQGRKELVIDAKAHFMAQRVGKHRSSVGGRSRTPPGFWRTDMPTTQENMRDKEEAKEIEREKVEERYREACRPRGLWMFKDE